MGIFKNLVIGMAVLAPLAASAQDLSPVTLSAYAVVPANLGKAVVYDRDQAIGIVSRVETDAAHKPVQVDVQLASGQMLKLNTAALNYDTQSNELIVTSADRTMLAMQ